MSALRRGTIRSFRDNGDSLRAYAPKVSGGGLQARELVRVLRDRADFAVLTTSAVKDGSDEVEGIPVYRVRVNRPNVPSQIRASLRFAGLLLRLVHAGGLVVTVMVKLFGKSVIVTLQN